jgi:hypothetical protein
MNRRRRNNMTAEEKDYGILDAEKKWLHEALDIAKEYRDACTKREHDERDQFYADMHGLVDTLTMSEITVLCHLFNALYEKLYGPTLPDNLVDMVHEVVGQLFGSGAAPVVD